MKKKPVLMIDPQVDEFCALLARIMARGSHAEPHSQNDSESPPPSPDDPLSASTGTEKK